MFNMPGGGHGQEMTTKQQYHGGGKRVKRSFCVALKNKQASKQVITAVTGCNPCAMWYRSEARSQPATGAGRELL